MAIVIGIDFSECGQKALSAGIQLALDLRSPVIIAHAFPEPLKAPVTAGLGYQETFQRFAAERETDEAIELTTQWAQKARDAGLAVEVVGEAAAPVDLLVGLSKRDDVTMLVVGTHGHGRLRKFLLGSVAEGVVRDSATPVLVVPG